MSIDDTSGPKMPQVDVDWNIGRAWVKIEETPLPCDGRWFAWADIGHEGNIHLAGCDVFLAEMDVWYIGGDGMDSHSKMGATHWRYLDV